MIGKERRWVIWAGGVCLALSTLLNVALSIKLRSLRTPLPGPRAGDRVPALVGVGAHGERISVTFSDAEVPTVLFVLRPDCVWCERNMADWRALVAGAGLRYRFVALSLSQSNLSKYLSSNHLNVPTIAGVPEKTLNEAHIVSTPETLVVEPNGTIRKAWVGAFDKQVRAEVEEFFGVSLPTTVGPAG